MGENSLLPIKVFRDMNRKIFVATLIRIRYGAAVVFIAHRL